MARLTKTASGLVIPTRMNEEPRYRCNFPGCDWKGYDPLEQVRHVMRHASEEEEVIHEICKNPTDEILGPGDVEKQKWQRERYEDLKKRYGPKEALDIKRY